jgi:NADH/NAD ratio-sensing transcriptional regulator Rex
MDNALKTKYTTRELKEDIMDNVGAILENRERIKNVERCMGDFSNHVTRHGEVLDPKLLRHDIILFGEKGDNGLAHEIDKLSISMTKIESGVNKVLWVVVLAVISSILKLVIFP